MRDRDTKGMLGFWRELLAKVDGPHSGRVIIWAYGKINGPDHLKTKLKKKKKKKQSLNAPNGPLTLGSQF